MTLAVLALVGLLVVAVSVVVVVRMRQLHELALLAAKPHVVAWDSAAIETSVADLSARVKTLEVGAIAAGRKRRA